MSEFVVGSATERDDSVDDGAGMQTAVTDGAAIDSAGMDNAEMDGAASDDAVTDGAMRDDAGTSNADGDGAEMDGAKTDGHKTDGAKMDDIGMDDAEMDGAEMDGAETDDAEMDGAEVDGAETEGNEPDENVIGGAKCSIVGLVWGRARDDVATDDALPDDAAANNIVAERSDGSRVRDESFCGANAAETVGLFLAVCLCSDLIDADYKAGYTALRCVPRPVHRCPPFITSYKFPLHSPPQKPKSRVFAYAE